MRPFQIDVAARDFHRRVQTFDMEDPGLWTSSGHGHCYDDAAEHRVLSPRNVVERSRHPDQSVTLEPAPGALELREDLEHRRKSTSRHI